MPMLIAQVAVTAIASYLVGRMAKGDAEEARVTASAGREVNPAPAAIDPLAVAPEPGGALPGIFGYRRVGGKVILSARSGNKSYLIIMIAGAPVTGFAGVYMNNALVTTNGAGNVTSRPWADVFGMSAVNIRLYDGTQTTADPELVAAFPGWNANYVGRNIAYARIIMDATTNAANNNNYFQSILGSSPDFTFGVLGFKCYDPRQPGHVLGNPATYAWSNNVSICRANYFIHELGLAKPGNVVDWASVASSANADDELIALAGGGSERRYTCAAYWMTDQRREDVLDKFNAANGGTFGPIGDLWRSTSGVYTAPTAAITPDDYEADGLTFADFPPISSAVNGVRGTFASPLHNFEMRDFPAFQDASGLLSDANGLGMPTAAAALWLDRSYEFVTSASQAQRLARIDYYRARFGNSASVALQFSQFDIVSGDVITLTDPLAGIPAHEFRVVSDAVDAQWTINLELERVGTGFFAWTTADEKPFTSVESLLGEPGGLKAPGFALIDTDAGANIVVNMRFFPSPSAGWDTYILNRGGTNDTAFPAAATVSNFTTVSNGTAAIGWSLRVRNSATGEESPSQSVATTAGVVANATEATTPQFRLPAAPSPRIRALNSGSAQLDIAAVPASRCDQIAVFSSATNDFGTAAVAFFLSNAAQTIAVSGAVGTVMYFWTVARNTATGLTGPASSPAVVVF
jgi:hypothetical protein